MNAPLHTSYTNELTPEILSSLDVSPFTEEQIAQSSEEIRAIMLQQRAYLETHRPCAIYRLATEGSQTRDGGVIERATSPLVITLDCGREVCVAQKGDCVVYPDGSSTQIVTCAGESNSHLALVGSRLCNGDEIVNTLQGSVLIIRREGESMPDDFLPLLKGEENQ